MSLTTGNALKAYVESLGLNIKAYRDRAPEDTKLVSLSGVSQPYVTIRERLALIPDGLEDGQATTAMEPVELNLWQQWLSDDRKTVLENPVYADTLANKLHGARINPIGTKTVYGVRVTNGGLRVADRDKNEVRHIFSLDVHRQI